jgi:Rhodopirellula transposase DDE domain
VSDLINAVEEQTGGSPTGHQKWVRRSLRQLSREMEGKGHSVSHTTVGRLLHLEGYSPKANRKRLTGAPHPDRDRQFHYIASQKEAFLSAGLPVISVDAKNKELLGNFKNSGRAWCREAEPVNAHDFKQDAVCQGIPYGLYVLNQNRGFVYVGTSASTPQFAVEAIVQWWLSPGQWDFRSADELLILCDSGGSNGWRPRQWKYQLQVQLADAFDLAVTVCHYPTGASKWNPVEHRLFGPISENWEGKPLRSLPVMLAYIRGTTTKGGLVVRARSLRKKYKTKLKVSNRQMASLNLERHAVCPNWNYTIRPRSETQLRQAS